MKTVIQNAFIPCPSFVVAGVMAKAGETALTISWGLLKSRVLQQPAISGAIVVCDLSGQDARIFNT